MLLTIADLGYHLLIPKEVFKEIRDVSDVADMLKHNLIDLIPKRDEADIQQIKDRHPGFHDGEISVLLLAQELTEKGERCRSIIDERDARKVAEEYLFDVNGVVGVLLWLKGQGRLSRSQCEKAYNGLVRNPRLPNDLLSGLIS